MVVSRSCSIWVVDVRLDCLFVPLICLVEHTLFECHLVGQDLRDKFSGAVEAFARRNGTGHGLHSDHSRHRSSDDVPSSKDVVS